MPEATAFLVFGDDWRRHPSSLQHLFLRLMGSHQVIWVNGINHRFPRLTWYDARRAASKVRQMIAPPKPTAWAFGDGRSPAALIAPKTLPWHNRRLVRAFNRKSLMRDIRRVRERIGADRLVAVFGAPAGSVVLDELQPELSIYFCMDNYSAMPNVTASLLRPLEDALLQRVDAVVATARELTTLRKPASGIAFHLPQGVNYDHFATARPVPPELRALPRPIIGFAGKVSTQVDVELVRKVALGHPQASVVLVGRMELDRTSFDLPNVHHFPYQRYEHLPAWVQAFDVGLVPYVDNAWTRSVDSLKQLEYLAAGCPVVSTAIPEAFKYEKVIAVAADHDGFLAAVASALAGKPRALLEERRAVALANTWERRADRFLEIVAEIRSQAPPRAAVGA